MIFKLIQYIVRSVAWKYGCWSGLFRKICRPNGRDYAAFLKMHGGFYSIGSDCSILTSTVFTDPGIVRIGNNVEFSTCYLIGQNGAVSMLQKAYGLRIDSVGKIDIKDNVFIGFNAIILPGITIGPNAIVAAGAVVTGDVLPGDIVAGMPARPIGKVETLVKKLDDETRGLPWGYLIRAREGAYDPLIEPVLLKMRQEYFFPRS